MKELLTDHIYRHQHQQIIKVKLKCKYIKNCHRIEEKIADKRIFDAINRKTEIKRKTVAIRTYKKILL